MVLKDKLLLTKHNMQLTTGTDMPNYIINKNAQP
ncbi:hypothetical protein ECP03018678_2929, partial [Escherichia coli P0301867.8]